MIQCLFCCANNIMSVWHKNPMYTTGKFPNERIAPCRNHIMSESQHAKHTSCLTYIMSLTSWLHILIYSQHVRHTSSRTTSCLNRKNIMPKRVMQNYIMQNYIMQLHHVQPHQFQFTTYIMQNYIMLKSHDAWPPQMAYTQRLSISGTWIQNHRNFIVLWNHWNSENHEFPKMFELRSNSKFRK